MRHYNCLTRSTLSSAMQAAVDSHGQEDVELWVHYAKYEQQQNRGAGSIYWRATKTLSDSEPFIAACRSQSIA